ncbi:hypodermin-A-like [Pieris brassicae]|uniref:Peptidase S1 domain-containing protein n=1 Tax=Pieris brassicae TaxID=7116 RepID=A0A9P0STH8_PIEBR|nr:hypodermin-A-like [Pieris brassicae]CAH3940538.1 unnamed protein product [Pieris brassicae]
MKYHIYVILLLFYTINAEDYEEVEDDGDTSSSVDSESNEVFNKSLSQKPKRDFKEINVTKLNEKPIKLDNKNNMKKSSYPYAVSIQRRNSHFASGALIDSKWILSAAGEFYNIREAIKQLRVRLGTFNFKKGGVLMALKGIEIHPLYSSQQPNYDIALLRLAQPVTYTAQIKPIPISAEAGEVVSGKFIATYWPRLIVNGQVLSASAKERVKYNSMRVSTQKLIPWAKCLKQMKHLNKTLDQSTLCLNPIVSLHSPCMPDVGAPIIADNLLWGITSGWLSDSCASESSPTLFTRLSDENVKFWLNSIRDIAI